MFWWANLSLRIAGADAMQQAGEDGSFDSEGFIKAGEELQRLIEMEPFQEGFLAAPWDGSGGEAATMGNGRAAMDLMGQWAPSTFAANAKDEKAPEVGWFPFPTVDGGAGSADEQFGGGDGFAIGKDAPAEAVDFVKFLVTSDVANKAGASGAVLPVLKGSESSVEDPNMKAVLDKRGEASYVQLYLDQAYAPAVGAAVNDAVQGLFAGKSTPEDVVEVHRGCRQGGIAHPFRRRQDQRSIPLTARSCRRRRRRLSRRARARRRWATIALFLAPALALYLLLVIAPVVQAIYYSGFAWSGLGSLDDFVGLENFKRAFSDDVFVGALKHNAIIALLSLGLQLPFALGTALLLNARLRGRAILRVLFFAPFVLSEVVTGVIWTLMLQPGGLADAVMPVDRQWLADPSIVLYTLFVVISWKYFGFHMILYLAGLQQIPRELEEAAEIDGATKWQVFRHVTLPLLGPTIRISSFLSIIGAIQLFDLVWVMTGGGPVNASNTMAVYMIDWSFQRFQFGYASAVAVIMLVISLAIALLYQRFVLKRDLDGALTTMGAR